MTWNPKLKDVLLAAQIFRKDSEINTYQLIQMWMAQGLIKLEDDSDQTQELEDVGMDYFRTLYSKSFFQDVKDHGYFFAFKMHDLLHDLALSVAQTKHSTIKSPAEKVSKNVQHVSFYDPDSPADELLIPLRDKKKVRSIYFQFNRVKPIERSFVETCISRFEFLRLLDLRESCFEALPSSIGGLKHLRYLDLSQNRSVKSLPDSLCELLCLQSLILDSCVEFEKLPRDFKNLTSLRFLYLTTQQRCFSKKGIGSLTSLRVIWITECGNLEYFFVDDDDDDGSPMQCLAGLRTLLIKDCETLLCLPRLRYLTSLEKLVISNCEKLDLMMADEGETDVLRSLQFFTIEQVPKLVALPQWLQGASETLNHIVIEDCLNFTTLPEWMKNLILLQKLEASGCQRLTSLPEFTFSLREIRISQCPELIRECQRETGKDWQKITCVPDIYLDNIKI